MASAATQEEAVCLATWGVHFEAVKPVVLLLLLLPPLLLLQAKSVLVMLLVTLVGAAT